MEVEICSDVTKARTKEMIEKNIFNRFAKLQNVYDLNNNQRIVGALKQLRVGIPTLYKLKRAKPTRAQ